MVVGIREAPGHARYRREPAHPFPAAQTRRTVAGSRCHQVHRLSTDGLAVLSSTEQLTGMGEGRCRRNIDREDRSLDEAGPFASAAATLTKTSRISWSRRERLTPSRKIESDALQRFSRVGMKLRSAN